MHFHNVHTKKDLTVTMLPPKPLGWRCWLWTAVLSLAAADWISFGRVGWWGLGPRDVVAFPWFELPSLSSFGDGRLSVFGGGMTVL